MNFTREELASLEEQQQIIDASEKALEKARHIITLINQEARSRSHVNALKLHVPGFLPPFEFSHEVFRFFVSDCWWEFPLFANYSVDYLGGRLFHIVVSREGTPKANRLISFVYQQGYVVLGTRFVPSLELIALGTLLMQEYYVRAEYVYRGIPSIPIKNPLLR